MKRLIPIVLVLCMIGPSVLSEPLLSVDVQLRDGDPVIVDTGVFDGYAPENPIEGEQYLLRISDFDNKTIESRFFDIEMDVDGHAPPTGEPVRDSVTLVFPYDNQTSHVTLYDEEMQRVDMHQVQTEPPAETTEQSEDAESPPFWIYIAAGAGILVIGAILYLSIDIS